MINLQQITPPAKKVTDYQCFTKSLHFRYFWPLGKIFSRFFERNNRYAKFINLVAVEKRVSWIL